MFLCVFLSHFSLFQFFISLSVSQLVIFYNFVGFIFSLSFHVSLSLFHTILSFCIALTYPLSLLLQLDAPPEDDDDTAHKPQTSAAALSPNAHMIHTFQPFASNDVSGYDSPQQMEHNHMTASDVVRIEDS